MIKLLKSIMAGLKVVFTKKSPSHYFTQNTIDLHEASKLDSVPILAKYEYDLGDTVVKLEEEKKKKPTATQIAPTPILTGSSAKKVLNQIKVKPSKETKRGIEILFDMFRGKEKSNDKEK